MKTMKLFTFICMTACFIWGGCDKKSTDSGNGQLGTPFNPSPANGVTGQLTDVTISWQCTNPVEFDVYFGTGLNPPLVSENMSMKSYDPPGRLEYNTTYYWRIVSKDSYGGKQVSGPVWSFKTAPMQSGFNIIGLYEPTSRNAARVQVSGQYAYLGIRHNSRCALEIVDISDPKVPVSLGMWLSDHTSQITDLRIAGNYAYLVEFRSPGITEMYIINISDPANPQLTGSYESASDYIKDVFPQGNHAYLGYRIDIYSLDISNPTNPTYVGSARPPSAPYPINEAIWVSGNYVYSTAGGISVYSISSPASPAYVGTWEAGGFGTGGSIHIQNNYAYIGVGGNNLVIVNVTNPQSPSLAGHYQSSVQGGYTVFVLGNYAYLGCLQGGLEILNIATPSSPGLVASWMPTDPYPSVTSVYVSGEYIYTIAAGLLYIIKYVP